MDNKSKIVAKNTFYLYIRMVFLMFIAFYTSRVILDKLGAEDYGLYNVVGSIAVTFVFFSSTLTNTTQRFVTIELGMGNLDGCKKVFNQHLIVYAIICLLVFVIAEIGGVWYIENKLNTTPNRLFPAHFIFQLSLLTVLFGLISVVFESLIISHEDMKIYSYVGVIEGLIKLGIAFIISVALYDKLIVYAILIFIASFGCKCFYVIYAYLKYKECRLKWIWDWKLISRSFSFIGWNLLGTAQVAVTDQGINLLLNSFFGTIANAARGLTNQVSGYIFQLSSNVLIAVQPQIVKSYARGDSKYMEKLFYNSSRFSFLALWVMVCPMLFCAEGLLSIWLKDIPQWTGIFLKYSLLTSSIYVLTKPIWSIVVASGNLRKYILLSCGSLMMSFPLAFIFLNMGYTPDSVYLCNLIVTLINYVIQLWVLHDYLAYSNKTYMIEVLYPILKVCSLSLLMAFSVNSICGYSFWGTICSVSIIIPILVIIVLVFGINKEERIVLKQKCLSVWANNKIL